jgi:hypothetical protein
MRSEGCGAERTDKAVVISLVASETRIPDPSDAKRTDKNARASNQEEPQLCTAHNVCVRFGPICVRFVYGCVWFAYGSGRLLGYGQKRNEPISQVNVTKCYKRLV